MSKSKKSKSSTNPILTIGSQPYTTGITLSPNTYTSPTVTTTGALWSGGIGISGNTWSGTTIGHKGNTLSNGILDIRSHLFKVDIGDGDDSLNVTTCVREIKFQEEKLLIKFLLDDKDSVRQAFTEYHYFRLSYLNTKGEPVETYEIKTDPLSEMKIILPDVAYDVASVPVWTLIWGQYTVTKI